MTPPPPPDSTEPSQAQTITLEFDLPHAPEKVWRALTDPVLLAKWLLPVINFKLEPGAAFIFKAPSQPGWDGIVHCRFREIETQRRLSWAWVSGDVDTVVTFALTPTEGGTLLSVVQSGFKPDQQRAVGGARYGWKLMGGKLVDVLGGME